MDSVLDVDIFTVIASFVDDTETLYTLARSFPASHPIINIVLLRLCQLPIPVSFHDGVIDADSLIDLLEYNSNSDDPSRFPIVGVIRHLILDTPKKPATAGQGEWRLRITKLLGILKNLRTLDWYGKGGPSDEDVQAMQGTQTLRTVRVDCGFQTSRTWTEDAWEIVQFASTIGARLTSLDLRKVNLVMYNRLLAQKHVFESYHALAHLALDITEGVWDWNQSGSPQNGASASFVFSDLGFPAVRQLEMRVGDLTIFTERAGPMDLVATKKLEELSFYVNPCVFWCSVRSIGMFLHIDPAEFPILTRFEIQDTIRNATPWRWPDEEPISNDWNESGRCYWGLVPRFLASIKTGLLQNLHELWVDETVLCMPKGVPAEFPFGGDIDVYSITELWSPSEDDIEEQKRKSEWIANLRLILGRMTSIRVGFGALNAHELGLVLDCCSEELKQFGFQYKWESSDRTTAVPQKVLSHLPRFPHLTDVHILRPRPGTIDREGNILRTDDPLQLGDIAAIFASNPSINRAGVGWNVWERVLQDSGITQPTEHTLHSLQSQGIIQIKDGYYDHHLLTKGDVPRFFATGKMLPYGDMEVQESRRTLTTEMREFRSLLQRILPSH